MKIRILIYKKEHKNFESDYIEFNWKKLKSKIIFEEIQSNRYLYFRKIKDYYKNNNIPYLNYLYDSFYEEQFNNIIP